jgi:cysteinyl-tRNA synthetase
MVDGRKMSKSLGNFYTVDDVEKKGFDPLALRYLYLGAHYRDPLNFTWDSLSASQNALDKLRNQVSALKGQSERTALSQEKEEQTEEFRNRFMEAMGDDLNTSEALAVTWDMLKSNIPSGDKYDLAMSFDEILGLKLGEAKVVEIPEDVKVLFEEREKLRSDGNYKEADKIRDQIQKLGFEVKDKNAKL